MSRLIPAELPGEVLAGVKTPAATEDTTGVGDPATETKVPDAASEAEVPTVPTEASVHALLPTAKDEAPTPSAGETTAEATPRELPPNPETKVQAAISKIVTPAEDGTPADVPTPTVPAETQVPAPTKVEGHTLHVKAKTPADTRAVSEAPAEVGAPTDTPSPAKRAGAPHGEVLAGVKIPARTEDPIGVGDPAAEVKFPALGERVQRLDLAPEAF